MERRTYSKKYKSAEELLAHLESQGLIIENPDKALEVIKSVGYFHLKGYLASLKTGKRFKDGARFESALDLMVWERNLRNLMLAQIGKFELKLRAAMVDEIGRGDGLDYLSTEPFEVALSRPTSKNSSETRWTSWRKTLQNLRDDAMVDTDHVFIGRFLKTYDSDLPLWMLIETFSLGQIKTMYEALTVEHKTNVANAFANAMYGGNELTADEFGQFLSIIREFRNMASHNNVFWDKKFELFRASDRTNRRLKSLPYFSADLDAFKSTYGIILALLFLENSWQSDSRWCDEIKLSISALERIRGIDSKGFGAPGNWAAHPAFHDEKSEEQLETTTSKQERRKNERDRGKAEAQKFRKKRRS